MLVNTFTMKIESKTIFYNQIIFMNIFIIPDFLLNEESKRFIECEGQEVFNIMQSINDNGDRIVHGNTTLLAESPEDFEKLPKEYFFVICHELAHLCLSRFIADEYSNPVNNTFDKHFFILESLCDIMSVLATCKLFKKSYRWGIEKYNDNNTKWANKAKTVKNDNFIINHYKIRRLIVNDFFENIDNCKPNKYIISTK